MRKILIILLFNATFVHFVNGQTLLQQIEHAYNKLDTASYFDDIVHSYQKSMEEHQYRINNTTLYLLGLDYTKISTTQRQHVLDSINNIGENSLYYSEGINIQDKVALFRFNIKSKNPCYVLNLIQIEEQTPQVDTNKLAFNLIYFDKRSKPKFYVLVDNGCYSHDGEYYPTTSMLIARNTPKVLRKILKKRPKYLLYSVDMEGINTFLYVLNDQIFVYRIAQMKEYELNEYLKMPYAKKMFLRHPL